LPEDFIRRAAAKSKFNAETKRKKKGRELGSIGTLQFKESDLRSTDVGAIMLYLS